MADYNFIPLKSVETVDTVSDSDTVLIVQGGVVKQTGKTRVGAPAGVVFTPSVSEDGDLSWTNNSSLENPEVVNIRGPRGEQGQQGEQGPQGIAGVGEGGLGLPQPTADDAGKAPIVNADGTGYELGNAGGGNVHYFVHEVEYTFTEEDVANFTSGDWLELAVDGFVGTLHGAWCILQHGSTGGTVFNNMSLFIPDAENKKENYRRLDFINNKSTTINAWGVQKKLGWVLYRPIQGTMHMGDVYSGPYWTDSSVTPYTTAKFSIQCQTLVAGLKMYAKFIEEVRV